MKFFLMAIVLLNLSNSFAQDMSRNEDYDSAYTENSDGSLTYIGKCQVHQDYENNKFVVTAKIVNYFEPFNLSKREFNKKMQNVEKELIIAAGRGDNDFLKNADDITIEKIKLNSNAKLDLFRLDIGVGGGNGMVLIFNRIVKNQKPEFEFMAEIFDGDVEYCDQKVWEN